MREKPIWAILRATCEQQTLELSPVYKVILQGDTVEEIEAAWAEAIATFKGSSDGKESGRGTDQ